MVKNIMIELNLLPMLEDEREDVDSSPGCLFLGHRTPPLRSLLSFGMLVLSETKVQNVDVREHGSTYRVRDKA